MKNYWIFDATFNTVNVLPFFHVLFLSLTLSHQPKLWLHQNRCSISINPSSSLQAVALQQCIDVCCFLSFVRSKFINHDPSSMWQYCLLRIDWLFFFFRSTANGLTGTHYGIFPKPTILIGRSNCMHIESGGWWMKRKQRRNA